MESQYPIKCEKQYYLSEGLPNPKYVIACQTEPFFIKTDKAISWKAKLEGFMTRKHSFKVSELA